jgi:hypothetical protein
MLVCRGCVRGGCKAHPGDTMGYRDEEDSVTTAHGVAEQPLPTAAQGPCIQDLVLTDILQRKQVGIERYGQALHAHNGRDMLQDAYEEALDLVMYLRGLIEERKTSG